MDGLLYDSCDLSNLTYIKEEDLKIYIEGLNALSPDEYEDKKIVVALGTGGTIAMTKDVEGKLVPDLNFNRIMNFVSPYLKENFLVKGLDIFAIDSSQMDYTYMRDLSICICYIWKKLKIPVIGFLVLHGTDTMTYSSATISVMMGQGLQFPIVYTGAQKPISEPVNDAVTNLHNALYTLEALDENKMAEVVVVMGDMAVLGTSAEKVDDSQVNAFEAPLHKYVARFNRLDYPVKLAPWLQSRRDKKFDPLVWGDSFSHTLLIKSHLGLCPDMVARQVKDEQIKAVILYSYGGNTVYKKIIDKILPTVKERNLNVFVVSPVNAELKTVYDSAYHMVKSGVVPLYMTLSAALAKIELAIRMHPDDPQAISEFMITDYVGEIPSDASRYIADK